MRSKDCPVIHVLAGVNGAGKSSIAGATIRSFGGDYFNPDEAARAIVQANPGLSQREANGLAWDRGRQLLEAAIAQGRSHTFESTLGGNTITRLLAEAAEKRIPVHAWFTGLSSPELHLKRVRARVRRGGHDIAEADIRRRYEHSRLNLIKLLPVLASLRVYDNSDEADPAAGKRPTPTLILHRESGKIVAPSDLSATPRWAKAIVAAAIKLQRR